MKKQVVLAVDDIVENVELMAAYLEDVDCEVVTAGCGTDALARIQDLGVDLVLLDVEMPGINGLEVCRSVKSAVTSRMVPIVMVTAYSAVEDRIAALGAGADDFLSKPVERTELVARVRSMLSMKSIYDSLVQSKQVIHALARAVEARDGFTEAHGERVADHARRLAIAAGLDEETVELTYFAALVHDIGKIGVPDTILTKRDALTSQEVAVLRQVPGIGAEICSQLRTWPALTQIIRHHRERIDGAGYPDGLTGDQIPQPARILGVCDAYDRLVNGERVNRPTMAHERARAVVEHLAGRAYDSALVSLFFNRVLPAEARENLDPPAG